MILYEDNRIVILATLNLTATSQPATLSVYDLAQAAQYLKVTPRKVRELYHSKALAGTRIDYRHWVFSKVQLDDYLTTHQQPAKRLR